MPKSGGIKATAPPKLTSFLSWMPKSSVESPTVSGSVLVSVSLIVGLKSALALSVPARTSRKDAFPTTATHARRCFALTTFVYFLGSRDSQSPSRGHTDDPLSVPETTDYGPLRL